MNEFKKRMIGYHYNFEMILRTATEDPTTPLKQYHHGYVKGFNEAEKNLLAIIEEARKEFPIKNVNEMIVLFTEYVKRDMPVMIDMRPKDLLALFIWFQKWFREEET